MPEAINEVQEEILQDEVKTEDFKQRRPIIHGYLLQVYGDDSFRLKAKSARKKGVKAEFLAEGWIYQREEDAKEVAKKWSQGNRKINVVGWYEPRVDKIWNGTKDEASIAKKEISSEIKTYKLKQKKDSIENEYNSKTGIHPCSLKDEKLPEYMDHLPTTEQEKNTHAYYKTLFDETYKEQERIDLLNGDIEREKADLEEQPRCSQFGEYEIRDTGLYLIKEDGDVWISSPVWPEAYLRDKEGKSHTLLIKIDDGEMKHKVVIPRRIINKWADLSEILLDLGQKLPTAPHNQKHLQNFLMHAKPSKFMRCVDKCGWHGDQYVFPDGEVIGSQLRDNEGVYPVNEVRPKGIGKNGSLEEWQDNVLSLCRNNSRLIFGLGVSLAAPCLNLIGDEGGVFNLKGISSIGKTRCLMLAISVFGAPDYKRSWRTTSNGLEGVCSLHNDSLLALDEFGQSDAKEVGEIAYMYSQGIGKQRSSRDGSPRESKTWRGMLLSTGEVGISDHVQESKSKVKAGQLVRVIDIPAQVTGAFGCFEDLHEFTNGSDGEIFADRIKDVCCEFYGTAGRSFIKALIEYGVEKSKKYLKFARDDFAANEARGYDGQVKRVANRFGLICAALCLGIEVGILSKYLTKEMVYTSTKRCFNDWLGDRGTSGDLESHAIIRQVIGILNENSDSKFLLRDGCNDDRIHQTIWGYKRGSEFYLFPQSFEENLCRGFDKKYAIETLKDCGLLIPDSNNKSSQSIRISHYKKDKARFYVINLDNYQESEDE